MEIYQTINVLIVDDEPNQLELLRYNLKQANFNVISSDNGEKAVELAEDILPDIIILDWMMPFYLALKFVENYVPKRLPAKFQ